MEHVRSYAGLEEAWPFVDYGPIGALLEQLRVGCQKCAEAALVKEDQEFRSLYKKARLSVGSEAFGETVKQAHQRATGAARRKEDVALRQPSAARGGRSLGSGGGGIRDRGGGFAAAESRSAGPSGGGLGAKSG